MATYYIDASGSDGDGLAPGTAWNNLLGHLGDISSGDIVWLRRTGSETHTLGSDTTIPGGVTLYGWPKATDPLYASRPTTGTSAWDSDGDDYYLLDTTGSYTLKYGDSTGVTAATLFRIHVRWDGNVDNKSCFEFRQSNSTVDTCKFEIDGSSTKCLAIFSMMGEGAGTSTYTPCKNSEVINSIITKTSSGNTTASSSNGWGNALYLSTCNNIRITGCTITVNNVDGCNDDNRGVFFRGRHVMQALIQNCTFSGSQEVDRSTVGANDDYIWFYFDSAVRYLTFADCTFENTHATNGTGPLFMCRDPNLYVYDTSWGNRLERCKILKGGPSYICGDIYMDLYDSTWQMDADKPAIQLIDEYARSQVTLVFRNCTFPASPTNGHIYDSCNADSRSYQRTDCFFDSCTTPSTLMTANNANAVFTTTTLSTGALNGYYRTESGQGYATSDATMSRSGGESFAIACTQTGGGVLNIGSADRPCVYLTLTQGASNTITAYGVHKNSAAGSEPTGNNFFFTLAYRNASGVLEYATSRGVAFVADGSSTWTGASGATVFKQSISVTVPAGTNQNVACWFNYSKAVDGQKAVEYLAFDPKLVVS